MNLKELKKMIAEEYSAYTEQAEPAVDVAPGDVDADDMGADADADDEDDAEALQERFKKLANIIKG